MSKDQRDVSHIDKGEINEPIAWTNKKNLKYLQVAGGANIWNQSIEKNDIPLYIHPQKELTDEEIINTLDKICYEGDSGCVTGSVTIFHQTIVNFARTILKKASEK